MPDYEPLYNASRRGGFGSLGVAAGLLLIAGVVGANVLSRMARNGELPAIAFGHSDRDMQRLAKSAPGAGRANQSVTIVRSVGIDGTTTATIPHTANSATSLSPCGNDPK